MKKVLVVALSLAMCCTACSTAWVSTLDSIVAAAAPALINILQIVAVANGKPMNSNLAAKINADATVIKTLAGDFAKASSGSAPGVCQQLQAAVSAYHASGRAGERFKDTGEDHTARESRRRHGSGNRGGDSLVPSQCAGIVQGSAALQRLQLRGSVQQHPSCADRQRGGRCGDPETETSWALETRAGADFR